MKLSELLTESAIVLGLDGLDKWQVIDVLTDQLVKAGRVTAEQRDPVHEALLARERQASTGMEHGVAIPHTSADEVEETAVALGVARGGVDFEAIDGNPTHLIILLVTVRNRTKAHIRTLAEIARLLSSEQLRAALIEAPSAEEALQRIRDAEGAVA